MTETRSIHTEEQVAMMSAALKARFPATKFSVSRELSMTGSIVVQWTDGPSVRLVTEITAPYEGKGFDGMTDSTTYREISERFRERILAQLTDFFGSLPAEREIYSLVLQAAGDATRFSKAHALQEHNKRALGRRENP